MDIVWSPFTVYTFYNDQLHNYKWILLVAVIINIINNFPKVSVHCSADPSPFRILYCTIVSRVVCSAVLTTSRPRLWVIVFLNDFN